jgi:hypothetical protein
VTKDRPRRSASTDRPTPVEAIEAKHARLAEDLGGRADRFSQLLAKATSDEFSGQYLVTRSGLTAEEHAELAAAAAAAHDGFKVELREALERLRSLLAAGDPFYILAVVQDLNLFTPWGGYYEPTHEGSEAKVELVAGLLATQPATSRERPSARAVQAVLDEVDHVLQAVLLFNLTMPRDGDPGVATLKFMSATRWMSVRGSSFAGHGEDLARAVYGPQAAWMLANLGFTIEDVIAVGRAALSLIVERRNGLGRASADAANAVTGTDREARQRALVAAVRTTEDGLRDAVSLTPEAICGIDPELVPDRVEAVLRELSVAVGSLPETTYTGLYDENPLRSKPFLELDEGYLLTMPGAMTRDVDRLLEGRLLARNPAFSRQRATTLDELAVEYLGRLLPGAETYTHLFYEGNELDGLVLFGDIAVVIEGKGSGISVPGQRGDTKRLGSDVELAVEDAWRQGARAREYLKRPGDAMFADERGAELVTVPDGRIRKVVIVNPTFHELAGFAPQLPRLRALGLFASGEFPWSVFINDLRVIAETAENPAVFVHYLEWRSRLPLGDRVTVFDEIDLWSSYLYAERFGDLDAGGEFVVGNASTDFDAYYDGLAGTGPGREPPRKFLPEIARSFVDRIAASRPPGWREATGVCLDLSIPELALLDADAGRVAADAQDGDAVSLVGGRLMLVGLPRGANPSRTLTLIDSGSSDPTFAIACRLSASGQPEIAWAQYRKPVTFELSDFERRATSMTAQSPAAAGSKKGRAPSR